MARSKFMARSKYNHHTMARSIEWVLLLHHRSIITQSMFSRLHVNAGPENLVSMEQHLGIQTPWHCTMSNEAVEIRRNSAGW